MRAPVVRKHKEVRTTVGTYSFMLLLEAALAGCPPSYLLTPFNINFTLTSIFD